MFDDDKDHAKAGSSKPPVKKKGLSRRAILKAGAAVAGAAVGSDAYRRFPDHLGAGHQEYRAPPCRRLLLGRPGDRRSGVEGPRLQGHDAEPGHLGRDHPLRHASPNRSTSPIMEGWQAKVAVSARLLQGIDVKKIKEFDNILPIFTKGAMRATSFRARASPPTRRCISTTPNSDQICRRRAPNG